MSRPAQTSQGTTSVDSGTAIAQISRAIRLDPRDPANYLHLGEAHRALRQWNEAAAAFERALTIDPRLAAAWNNLGLVRQKQGRPEAAKTHFEQALSIQPRAAAARNNLARVTMATGQIEEAVAHYRQAVALDPADAFLHSNLLFALQFLPGMDADTLRREHTVWNERHAHPLRSSLRPHTNSREPARRLKIGYVSADFYQHPVAFFLFPLFSQHDARQVEVYAYADVKRPDVVTAGLRKLATVWREVTTWPDATLADQIRADGIDVLVDLAMHAANSRLLVFARRPAPVQVSWLAYPGTTGLDAIDYRLTDACMDPVESTNNAGLQEQPMRLPDAWCCYHPLGETPPVSELPASRPGSNGAVTFGCLNNFTKINPTVLRCWARVLAAVPGSRLLLHSPAEEAIHWRVLSILSAHGVSGDRVEFVPTQGRRAYLQSYGRIDIGLDPFPFNGMTTTCEALYQGVPVVALAGKISGSRVGASLLSTVGLKECVAGSEEEYVELAKRLAGNLPRLEELRQTLRRRLETSPLMDAPRFARHVEAAYRTIWQRWCGE